MRSGGISYFINRFHSSIYCSIKTNRVFRTRNIQINRSRNTDGINAASSQLLSSCKRAVAADYYQTFNAMLATDFCPQFLPFRCAEFMAARCIQESATLGNRIRNMSRFQINNLFI